MRKAASEAGLSLTRMRGQHLDFGLDCSVIFDPRYHIQEGGRIQIRFVAKFE